VRYDGKRRRNSEYRDIPCILFRRTRYRTSRYQNVFFHGPRQNRAGIRDDREEETATATAMAVEEKDTRVRRVGNAWTARESASRTERNGEPEKQPVRLLWPQDGCPSHGLQRSRTLRSVRLDVAQTSSERIPRLSAIGMTSSRGVYSPASSESRSIHDSQLVGSLSRRSTTAVGNEIVTDCRCRMPGRCPRIIRSIAEVILRGYSLP